jgi:hypothetical protein
MKLVIPRDKWERGTGEGLLWNEKTDCGCALGHYGLALGYSKEELVGCGTPAETWFSDDDVPKWPSWALVEVYDDAESEDEPRYEDSRAATKIIEANDHDDIQDREAKLVDLFAKYGVGLEFV